MKRNLALVLFAVMLIGLLGGCGTKGEVAEEKPVETNQQVEAPKAEEAPAKTEEPAVKPEDLPVIRVAVMPFYNGASVGYILDNALDVKNGFKVEPIMFSSGAPMNEALSTDSFDVAATGGAYVFGIASFGAKIIGPYDNSTGGNELWIKKSLKAVEVKGFNPNFPEVLGNPDTVKGLTLLQTTGTTGQYVAVKWLEALGLTDKDVKTVHMDFATVYQAFKSDRGDAAALVSPYCFQTDDTMVKAADLKQLGLGMYSELMMPAKAYDDQVMRGNVIKLLKVMYQVGDEFKADHEKYVAAVTKWYKDNGSTATDEQIRAECDLKSFVTTEQAKSMEFGKAEISYAEFMASQDKITPDSMDDVKANIATEAFQEALK